MSLNPVPDPDPDLRRHIASDEFAVPPAGPSRESGGRGYRRTVCAAIRGHCIGLRLGCAARSHSIAARAVHAARRGPLVDWHAHVISRRHPAELAVDLSSPARSGGCAVWLVNQAPVQGSALTAHDFSALPAHKCRRRSCRHGKSASATAGAAIAAADRRRAVVLQQLLRCTPERVRLQVPTSGHSALDIGFDSGCLQEGVRRGVDNSLNNQERSRSLHATARLTTFCASYKPFWLLEEICNVSAQETAQTKGRRTRVWAGRLVTSAPAHRPGRGGRGHQRICRRQRCPRSHPAHPTAATSPAFSTCKCASQGFKDGRASGRAKTGSR